MKIESMRDLTKEELLQKKHEITQDLFNLKLRKSLKELDDPLRLRTLRRDIARIETILTEDKKNIHKIVDSKTSILNKTNVTETGSEESNL